MKKTTAIICTIAAVALILAATFTAYYTLQTNSNPKTKIPTLSTEPPNGQVKVTGDFTQEKTLTIKQLSQMQLTNVTVLGGDNSTYTGVTLIEFCNQTGLNWDAGPLNIIGASGHNATLNVFQAWNSTYYPYYYNNNVIVLAFIKDGQWLANESGGPVKLIAPYFSDEYQVPNVAEVHGSPWTVSVSGSVSNPLVITGENLTCVHPKTVHAEFRPGGEPSRTSDWTGLPILDVLQAANMSDRAETLTIVATDGYVKNYTLDQIKDGQMMIGYQENGQPLPTAQGGPFRLFAPTDQYKWGQYWVKFISQIIVS